MTFHAIDAAKARFDDLEAKKDFIQAAMLIAGSGLRNEAARKAEARPDISTRVAELLKKAATEAINTGASGLDLGTIGARFVNTLRNYGAFDALAADANPFPLGYNTVAVDAMAVTASEVGEGTAKPIRRLQFNESELGPTKIIAQIVATRELIDAIRDEGMRLIDRVLTAAVAVGADAAMLSALSGNSAASAGVSGLTGFWIDLEEAIRAIDSGNGSRLYLIVDPELAKVLSLALLSAHGLNVPASNYDLGPVRVLATDAQTTGRITVVDARGLGIAQSPLGLRSSTEAAVEISDEPSGSASAPTATQVVSLWQTNSVALLAERSIVVKAVRSNAHYHIENSPLVVTDSPIG
jgi:hypothetical protein